MKLGWQGPPQTFNVEPTYFYGLLFCCAESSLWCVDALVVACGLFSRGVWA